MKKLFFLTMAAAIALTACEFKPKEETNAEAAERVSRDELVEALDTRDSLIALIGEISEGVTEIKRVENMIDLSGGESPARKQEMIKDLQQIQQLLIDRRARLEELQKKLQKSNVYSSKLEETINGLQAQIAEQTQTIESLNAELGQAKVQIGQLGQQVDSLNTTVATVTDERDAAQQEAVNTANELNLCYYVVADNKALKAHKIIESGFLRKTKILKGDFDQSFFVTADKRNLNDIETTAKKLQVMTNQPADSYQIIDGAKGKTLRITNPTRFWSLTNYLVVKAD